MPIFREAGPDARDRLARESKGFRQRQVYHDLLSQVDGGKSFEVRPIQLRYSYYM
jgi:hypothetical protein